MTTSEQIDKIAPAFVAMQAALAPAIKDATNPAYKSKYADLAANVEAARAPLAKNALAVLQEPVTVERGIAVTTRILHSSGQWIQFDPLTVPMAKPDAHGVGSAITYARRYALGAALGLVAEDDDGNAAVRPQQAAEKPVVVKPAGFDKWFADLQKVALKGAPALREVYAAEIAKPYRAYLLATNKEAIEDLKTVAFDADMKAAKGRANDAA